MRSSVRKSAWRLQLNVRVATHDGCIWQIWSTSQYTMVDQTHSHIVCESDVITDHKSMGIVARHINMGRVDRAIYQLHARSQLVGHTTDLWHDRPHLVGHVTVKWRDRPNLIGHVTWLWHDRSNVVGHVTWLWHDRPNMVGHVTGMWHDQPNVVGHVTGWFSSAASRCLVVRSCLMCITYIFRCDVHQITAQIWPYAFKC